MSEKEPSAEQIVGKLRMIEVEMSEGATTSQTCKNAGITDQTYYRWREEYGGMRLEQTKRLGKLEKENARLTRLVAGQALDLAILEEVAQGTY